jgi:hypothetical protein
MIQNTLTHASMWAAAPRRSCSDCAVHQRTRAPLCMQMPVSEQKKLACASSGMPLPPAPRESSRFKNMSRNMNTPQNVVFNFTGTCTAATQDKAGNDFYDGDIRIVIPNTSVDATVPIPGKGCPDKSSNSGWGSWSNFPNDLLAKRSCLYNMKLGDDPWNATPYLNHTLHEFGHALGLAHEHDRTDVDRSSCNAAGFGGGISSGFLTPYDKDSVMHYQFTSCGINGNYDYTGLSLWDQLGVHILYPEDQQVAEFVGTTVIRSGDTLRLQSAWEFRGANINTVASEFVWKLNATSVSTSPDLYKVMSTPGSYKLKLSHKDFLDRTYSYDGTVRVLTQQNFIRQIVAPIPLQRPLF